MLGSAVLIANEINATRPTDIVGEAINQNRDFAWFGHLGIRSITVSRNSNFRPPVSPIRPFADHLEALLRLADAKGMTEDDYKPMLATQVYVIRTCFLMIVGRARDHCPTMKPPGREEVTRSKG